MGHFQRSSMDGVQIPLALSIDHFSLRSRRGFFEGQEFECGRATWKLVVFSGDPLYGDFLDVRLRRCDLGGGDLFVDIKLSIVDCLGSRWFSRQQKLCFSHREDTQRVLSEASSFNDLLHRLNRRRLLPGDTLTLRGEMTVYQETEMTFEEEEDFRRSLSATGGRWWSGWLETTMYLVVLVARKVGVVAGLALGYLLLPILVYVVWPLIVLVSKKSYAWVSAWIKGWVENAMAPSRPRGGRQRNNPRHELEILPYGDKSQNVVLYQTDQYTYLVKRMPNGLFERKVKQYAEDGKGNYKPRNRYICQ